MQGDKQIIKNFNCLLVNELIAMNQFFIHSRILNHFGLIRLGNIEHKESVDEMKHADFCIKRIMFLEGVPDIQNSLQQFVHIGKDVEEIFCIDLNLEKVVVDNLRTSIKYADLKHDFVSRDIMVKILVDEEKHIDYLETEMALIIKIGIKNYLQSQLR